MAVRKLPPVSGPLVSNSTSTERLYLKLRQINISAQMNIYTIILSVDSVFKDVDHREFHPARREEQTDEQGVF